MFTHRDEYEDFFESSLTYAPIFYYPGVIINLILVTNIYFIPLILTLNILFIWFWRKKIFSDIIILFVYEIGYNNFLDKVNVVKFIILPIIYITIKYTGIIENTHTNFFVGYIIACFSLVSLDFIAYKYICRKWLLHRDDEFILQSDPDYIPFWENFSNKISSYSQKFFDKF